MSFNTSLSGLNAASYALEVISNNIANSDTTGFKQSTVQFADLYAASVTGTTAESVGMGVRIQDLNQDFSQGAGYDYTESALDLAISGDGFFMVDTGSGLAYTRAGNFTADNSGSITNPDGYELQGYLADSSGQITGQIGSLTVSTGDMAPSATSEIEMEFYLDASATAPTTTWGGPYDAFATPATAPSADEYNYTNSTTIYDSLGNEHTQSLYYVKTSTANQWDVYVLIDGVQVANSTITFQSDGTFASASLPVEVSVSGWAPLDEDGNANGAATQSYTIDLSDSKQYSDGYSLEAINQDGYASGEFSSIAVSEEGVIYVNYSNDQSVVVGQVILAGFANEQGLKSVGDNLWLATYESGAALVNTAASSGMGNIISGALENSNVDVAEQMIQMIEAQRNYEANAQSIQAQDELLQTIINLR